MRQPRPTLDEWIERADHPSQVHTAANTGVHAARCCAPLATAGCESHCLGQAVDMPAPTVGRLRHVVDPRNVRCHYGCNGNGVIIPAKHVPSMVVLTEPPTRRGNG